MIFKSRRGPGPRLVFGWKIMSWVGISAVPPAKRSRGPKFGFVFPETALSMASSARIGSRPVVGFVLDGRRLGDWVCLLGSRIESRLGWNFAVRLAPVVGFVLVAEGPAVLGFVSESPDPGGSRVVGRAGSGWVRSGSRQSRHRFPGVVSRRNYLQKIELRYRMALIIRRDFPGKSPPDGSPGSRGAAVDAGGPVGSRYPSLGP